MELKCPKCNTAFQVDENDYQAIVAQVRTAEFDAELERRLRENDARARAEERSRALEAERNNERKLADKERAMEQLRIEIERMKTSLDSNENTRKAELSELNAKNIREIAALSMAKDKEIATLSAEKDKKIAAISAEKDKEIAALKSQIDMNDKQRELDIINERNLSRDEINANQRTIMELNSKLESQKMAAENRILELNEQHTALIKAKDEEIEHYRDMKSRLSTKMLGETLEQHCSNTFNSARSRGMFPTAYFEKDNDIAEGTKGDFIFRDYIDGEEYISIMFEMKNEDDKTATKHRNEDFFAKLDKDRCRKDCEYAVLVSMLEADNELYNEGIVDVSYRYDKMFVIRPQFFMSVISMLSRAARRGAERMVTLRRELEVARAQSIDVTNFERRRDQFVDNFKKLVDAHLKKQDDAIADLDKAIAAAERQAENLRKIKSTFEASRQKLVKANESAENDFTIKKLTRGNPTMKAKFEEARRLESSRIEDLSD